MTTINKKSEKLAMRLGHLVDHMHKHHRDLIIHQRVDLFYYMQMETELKLLSEKLIEVSDRLREIERTLEEKYRQTFLNWQKDARWLSNYLATLDK